MNKLKIARVILMILSTGVSVGSMILSGKELDVKIDESVVKHLENK